ncbi:type IV secretion protein Rhs, partial [Variovorax beijingensis]
MKLNLKTIILFFELFLANLAYRAAANYAIATSSKYAMPEIARTKINEAIASLTDLKSLARDRIMRLADEGLQYGIAWMIVILKTALAKRKAKLAGNVSAVKGAEVAKKNPGGEHVALATNAPVTGDPNDCKNCPARAKGGGAISFAMGCETFTHTDFVLSAPLPIAWARTYRSNLGAFDQDSFGARWLTPYSTRVDVAVSTRGKRRGKLSLIHHGSDGRSHAYPLLAVGQHHRDSIEEVTLTRLSPSLLTLDFGKPMPAGTPSDWRETYELVDTAAAKVRTQAKQHFRLVAQHASNGLAIGLRYDHVIAATGEQVLSDIVSKQGDVTMAHVGTRPHAQSGLIDSLWEIREGQVVRQLAAYVHDAEGDLVSAQDENGAGWQYSYSHHLVTRYTDRTG